MLCHTGCVLLRTLDIEGNFRETIIKAWQDEIGTCGKTSLFLFKDFLNMSHLKVYFIELVTILVLFFGLRHVES